MIKGMGVKHVIVRVSMTSAGSLVSVFSCLCACVCVRLMCCLTLKHNLHSVTFPHIKHIGNIYLCSRNVPLITTIRFTIDADKPQGTLNPHLQETLHYLPKLLMFNTVSLA